MALTMINAATAVLIVQNTESTSAAFQCWVRAEHLKHDRAPSHLLPAALRAAQICRYLVYSEADFESMEEGTEVPSSTVPSSIPNFTPIGATTRV